jgi:hypothetical protein
VREERVTDSINPGRRSDRTPTQICDPPRVAYAIRARTRAQIEAPRSFVRGHTEGAADRVRDARVTGDLA